MGNAEPRQKPPAATSDTFHTASFLSAPHRSYPVIAGYANNVHRERPEEFDETLRQCRGLQRVARYLRALGPGLITGASDDDPCSIGTYAQTGALLGYAQLWVVLLTVPMMIAGRAGSEHHSPLSANAPRSVLMASGLSVSPARMPASFFNT